MIRELYDLEREIPIEPGFDACTLGSGRAGRNMSAKGLKGQMNQIKWSIQSSIGEPLFVARPSRRRVRTASRRPVSFSAFLHHPDSRTGTVLELAGGDACATQHRIPAGTDPFE